MIDKVIQIARTWLGTPYHHQASVKGVGCDCLGLVRGVWRELYGLEATEPLNYSPRWGDRDNEQRLLVAFRQHLNECDLDQARLYGNILVFYVKNARSAKHCAIVSAYDKIIHSYIGKGVVETSIGYWINHIAGVFSFPERVN